MSGHQSVQYSTAHAERKQVANIQHWSNAGSCYQAISSDITSAASYPTRSIGSVLLLDWVDLRIPRGEDPCQELGPEERPRRKKLRPQSTPHPHAICHFTLSSIIHHPSSIIHDRPPRISYLAIHDFRRPRKSRVEYDQVPGDDRKSTLSFRSGPAWDRNQDSLLLLQPWHHMISLCGQYDQWFMMGRIRYTMHRKSLYLPSSLGQSCQRKILWQYLECCFKCGWSSTTWIHLYHCWTATRAYHFLSPPYFVCWLSVVPEKW